MAVAKNQYGITRIPTHHEAYQWLERWGQVFYTGDIVRNEDGEHEGVDVFTGKEAEFNSFLSLDEQLRPINSVVLGLSDMPRSFFMNKAEKNALDEEYKFEIPDPLERSGDVVAASNALQNQFKTAVKPLEQLEWMNSSITALRRYRDSAYVEHDQRLNTPPEDVKDIARMHERMSKLATVFGSDSSQWKLIELALQDYPPAQEKNLQLRVDPDISAGILVLQNIVSKRDTTQTKKDLWSIEDAIAGNVNNIANIVGVPTINAEVFMAGTHYVTLYLDAAAITSYHDLEQPLRQLFEAVRPKSNRGQPASIDLHENYVTFPLNSDTNSLIFMDINERLHYALSLPPEALQNTDVNFEFERLALPQGRMTLNYEDVVTLAFEAVGRPVKHIELEADEVYFLDESEVINPPKHAGPTTVISIEFDDPEETLSVPADIDQLRNARKRAVQAVAGALEVLTNNTPIRYNPEYAMNHGMQLQFMGSIQALDELIPEDVAKKALEYYKMLSNGRDPGKSGTQQEGRGL